MTALQDLPNAQEATAWLITYASGFDQKIVSDQATDNLWLTMLGRFDPNIIKAGIETHYVRSDKRQFPLKLGELAAWCESASPPRERCPEHPSYYLGTGCGGCRGERIERGEERMIGQSTVPKLSGKQVPRPDNWAQLLKGIPE